MVEAKDEGTKTEPEPIREPFEGLDDTPIEELTGKQKIMMEVLRDAEAALENMPNMDLQVEDKEKEYESRTYG